MKAFAIQKLFLLFAVMAFFSASAGAQSVALSKVSGTVTDSTGGSVPGAQIRLTNTGTGSVRTAQSSAEGAYAIPDLSTGAYKIEVSKEGFKGYVQSGITLQVGSNPTINVALEVGAVTQEVTVVADQAMVETHSSSLGQVVSQQQVLDIPLNARDPMQLLTLTPSAVLSTAGAYNGSWEFPNPYTIAFAGTNPGAGNYILDGGNDNDDHGAGSYPLPFPDALQEFKVDTSAVPAMYGMHSAATVNAVTRSGTNKFHGDLFEFVRNYDFNARNFYAPVRDPLKRNQFGGVVGGPIRKDKLFFFGALQSTRVRDQTNNVAFLPTAEELAGNFTDAVSPACNGGNAVALKGPFTGGATTTSPTNFSSPSVKLAALLPTSPDPLCGKYTYAIKVQTNALSIVGKVDYHINDKQSIFARYYYSSYALPEDETNYLTLNQAAQQNRYNTVTLGHTYILSNSLVNSLHLNLNRSYNHDAEDPNVVSPADLGVPGYWPYPHYISVTVGSGVFGVKPGTSDTPVYFNNTDFQAADDISFTHGKHQFGFGGEWIYFNDDSESPIFENGQFNFTGGTTGLAMADYLFGINSTFEQSNIVSAHNRKNFYAIYAQDSWQPTRRLTINFGLRWEPYVPNYNVDGQAYHFSLAAFNAGAHSTVYPNAPAGLQYPSVQHGKPGDYSGFGTSYIGDWNHYEPRIGLSYDPTGKGREVIRASYGVFYDFESLQYTQAVSQSSPWADATILNNVNFTNPYATFTYNGVVGNPYPIANSSNFVFPNAGAFQGYSELHPKATQLQQWNASIERQLGSDWSLTASYIGNKANHLGQTGEFNPAEWVPSVCGTSGCTASTTQRRLLALANPSQGAYYSTIAELFDNAWSNYNAAIVSLQKHLSHNFSAVANYTFSHCIDTADTGAIVGGDGWLLPQSQQVGNCTWDHRQQLTINGVIKSPKFESLWTRRLAGNWQLAPIVSHITGDWLTVTTGVDTALEGTSAGQRPNQVGSSATPITRIGGTTYGIHYFNPKAYAAATVTPGFTGNVINIGNGPITVGPIGNLGRNTMNGPAQTQFDLALTRFIPITERNVIELRAEAFNILNLVRYYDPTVAMNSSTFGESIAPTATGIPGYSSPQDPRIMQFAVKYTF